MRICDNVAEILLSKLNCSVMTFVIMVSNNYSAWIDPTYVWCTKLSVTQKEKKRNKNSQQNVIYGFMIAVVTNTVKTVIAQIQ